MDSIEILIGFDWWKKLISSPSSCEETLRFIRPLKLQAHAIIASGEYGYFKTAPTADRAISRLSTSALDCLKALDANRPEECVKVMRNFRIFTQVCPHVIDADVELQCTLMTNLSKRYNEANEWVIRVKKELAEKGAAFYAQAEKQHDPVERKRLLSEVKKKNFELHERLQDKLKDCQLRDDNSMDAPLVSDVKSRMMRWKLTLATVSEGLETLKPTP